ncbi:GFA family protein [Sediminicoccus sp. KRV36]|uniref:GFA family protein n=1 Tax=Sediminicoccus sp. KRV36 TaxID=3133721 RepID=UPI00200F897D|nr:GFA family protein [Sediminicoccus rosea]UPY37220.1 GFA family protein [Sediminicoccus rosea]
MDLPQTGRCQCGSLCYEITAVPRIVYACHCTDCQKQSGSAFGMGLVVAEAEFRLTCGDPGRFERRHDSGRRSEAWFCRDCGTRLGSGPINAPDDRGMLRILRAGTLDDTSWLRPAVHVWVRSAQPWVKLPDGVPRFETRPPVPVWLLSTD